ncbi:hypothetical protein X943_002945 [Babesia divergens]|uniref:Uncharacterized protein n=1 Tax=Babesia divergens TaxID=32595 RepID=A0AAD9GEV9_BABDI|nr:hypothetical protein X943_002945 [Babesia divergens]
MEMGTDVENVQIVKVDVAEVKEYGGPKQEKRYDERKTDVPKEIVNDSQESLEGALDDIFELVKEIIAGFLTTIIIASNTLRCIMVVIILLLCI